MSLQYSEITISKASPVVQWLKLHTLNAGGPGSILDWGTKSQRSMPQLRMCMLQRKILHAASKTPCSQIKK